MHTIQLLYAASAISRHPEGLRQDLEFRMLVENLAFEKLVEVHWAGEDGNWRTLAAAFHAGVNERVEVWRARASFTEAPQDPPLPGDIRFALRYHVGDQEFWDNNNSSNHEIIADSGIHLSDEFTLLNIDDQPLLAAGQDHHPIVVAVRRPGLHKKVFVRWTPDRWNTVLEAPCLFKRRHWDRAPGGTTRNPNRYGDELWITQLRTGDAFRVDYAIGCECGDEPVFWDDNFGANYHARHDRLKVLTLNLHCLQEENQDAKLSAVARAISELGADIVCLQEVAEPWNDGSGDWAANTARIIRDRTDRPYHLHCDWSHRGFGRFREGSAILSKYGFAWTDSRYVSSVRDPGNINARKVVMACVPVPCMGLINVYSTHLSWWSGGFPEQFANLRQWASDLHGAGTAASLLCGDFNAAVGTEGYELLTADGGFGDEFLRARAQMRRAEGPAIPVPAERRIDFIAQRRGGSLDAVAARELFTDSDYGRVSDHPGYVVEFEPR